MPIGIDFSINIGIILQTGLVIGGGLIGYGALRGMVKEMEKDMVEIRKDQKDMSKVLAEVAVQNSRLNRLEEDIRDLRHGRGLIVDVEPSRRVVRRDPES